MTPVFGYFRQALVHPSARSDVTAQLEQAAQNYGGSAIRLFAERGSAVGVLWRMAVDADSESCGLVLPRIRSIADRDGISLDQVLAAPVQTMGLVSLMVELARLGERRGYLVTPTPAHLAFPPGLTADAVLHLITAAAPGVTVLYTSAAGGGTSTRVEVPLADDDESIATLTEAVCRYLALPRRAS
ncbi:MULTISPECIES: hypothetical protein [unclassified Nocardia]|uniref:hypothetical protein n=1 Tax=unclassified Nocardia TaxID=2637762 RepID=UPI001CE41604|nr:MULTISPECIES: hypothetical protein [unclassified Nocardia]